VREGSSGLALTLPVTPSADLSDGVAVGGGVNDLAPGDAVFGVTKDRFIGAYAEFALADASHGDSVLGEVSMDTRMLRRTRGGHS